MSDDDTPGPPWTVLKILRWTTGYFDERGMESSRINAEALLSHVLGMERVQLYAHFDRRMDDGELDAYRALVKRRAEGEPAAYITGSREFWSLEIGVDDRVLIPRPDTETLVRAALDRIDEDDDGRLVDIGTGSGAIAIAIATERPQLKIAATDADSDALDVAAANIEQYDLQDRITCLEGDLVDAIDDDWRPVDYIVSNPPYVEETCRDELQPEVRDFEPVGALFAGDDGLDVIRRLIPAACDVLAKGGDLLIEIGYQQGDAVRQLLEDSDFCDIEILQDYGDRDRVAAATRPSS